MYFITGNKNKLAEIQKVMADVEQLDIDLPEIQDVDAHKIIEAKLHEAKKHHDGDFFVEDTSLYFDCMNGLPGPLIKRFLQELGQQGIYDIVSKLGDMGASAKTIIGYMDKHGDIQYFVGELKGTIVAPLTATNFGWDSLFQPEGYDKSFAQLKEEKIEFITMRTLAVEKMKQYMSQK